MRLWIPWRGHISSKINTNQKLPRTQISDVSDDTSKIVPEIVRRTGRENLASAKLFANMLSKLFAIIFAAWGRLRRCSQTAPIYLKRFVKLHKHVRREAAKLFENMLREQLRSLSEKLSRLRGRTLRTTSQTMLAPSTNFRFVSKHVFKNC